MGHPICGDMKAFVDILQKDGFEKRGKKFKFRGMKTKTMYGAFWRFPECNVVVRQPSGYSEVTSIFIHPLCNYVLLADLIETLDSKYGAHDEYISNINVNAITYSWGLPEGYIQIFASTIYGQVFDIVYRDYVEVRLLNNINQRIDSDL